MGCTFSFQTSPKRLDNQLECEWLFCESDNYGTLELEIQVKSYFGEMHCNWLFLHCFRAMVDVREGQLHVGHCINSSNI